MTAICNDRRHHLGCNCAETTLPPMTLDSELVHRLRITARKAREWTEERDRIIKQAVAAGGSLREVGEHVGLSHTAVKFIAHGRPSRAK